MDKNKIEEVLIKQVTGLLNALKFNECVFLYENRSIKVKIQLTFLKFYAIII